MLTSRVDPFLRPAPDAVRDSHAVSAAADTRAAGAVSIRFLLRV